MSKTLSPSVDIGAIILAAGKGTRMHSAVPKVLQRMLDEPMLRYVHDAVREVCPQHLRIVIGHGAEMVTSAFPDIAESFVVQEQQLGTGHALQTVWPCVLEDNLDYVLVVNGDTPLLSGDALRAFLKAAVAREADIAFITLVLDDPGAFGRVVRKDGRVDAIVEAKDYDEALHGVTTGEINAGIYCLKASAITDLLPRLTNENKSGEFYITDLVGLAVAEGKEVFGHIADTTVTLLGINTPAELVRSEEVLRERIVQEHMDRCVIIRAAHSVRIGPDVRIAPGADITGPCELYGKSTIGPGVRIASNCVLQSVDVEEGTEIRSFCHMERARIAARCIVGPFARLRPGAELDENAHVGNFVEIKNAHVHSGAKVNHLSYVGDADVGEKANIGAGTITCNYDGKKKHRTVIGKHAFIGSNTALVAPVTVGDGALIGAGSVITKDVPGEHLGLTRAPQKTFPRRKE